MTKRSTADQLEALVAELDTLARTIDIDACTQNLYDLNIAEPAYDSDDADKLAYARQLRSMITSSYGV